MSDRSEEWIAQSLARLEEAEQERESHERALENVTDPAALRRHSVAIETLDSEIRSLYAELEAVAEGEGDDGSMTDHVPTSEFQTPKAAPAPVAKAPARAAPAPAPAPLDDYDPFGTPAAAPMAAAVAAVAPAPSSFGGDTSFATTTSYDDDERAGGGMKWVVLGVLVLGGGGVGAYLMGKQSPEAAPASEPAAAGGAAQVISASPIPPDTQGPQVAQGADVDRTPGTQIRASSRPRSSGGGGGGGSRQPAPKKSGRTIEIEKSRDPLAGL